MIIEFMANNNCALLTHIRIIIFLK